VDERLPLHVVPNGYRWDRTDVNRVALLGDITFPQVNSQRCQALYLGAPDYSGDRTISSRQHQRAPRSWVCFALSLEFGLYNLVSEPLPHYCDTWLLIDPLGVPAIHGVLQRPGLLIVVRNIGQNGGPIELQYTFVFRLSLTLP
jgi:hypothetical protein